MFDGLQRGRILGPPKLLILEVNPQTEFNLARGVCLSGDIAKRRRIVESQRWVARVAGGFILEEIGKSTPPTS